LKRKGNEIQNFQDDIYLPTGSIRPLGDVICWGKSLMIFFAPVYGIVAYGPVHKFEDLAAHVLGTPNNFGQTELELSQGGLSYYNSPNCLSYRFRDYFFALSVASFGLISI
jgi:hypothetical protein